MKEYMTSFGVPITSKVVGGTMEELQDSISEKLSAMNEKDFPSLENVLTEDEKQARGLKMKNQCIIHLPKPGRLRKGVLLSSEPLYLVDFCRGGDRFLAELTKRQILDLLEGDGIILIHLQASIDEEGNWREREVRL